MNLNIIKMLTMSCGLALSLSVPAGNAFARGGSGGHSSGMSHFSSHSMSTSHNFAHVTRSNFTQNRNTVRHFSTINTSRHFANGKMNRFQRLTSNKKFKYSKSPYWSKYCGWGKSGGPWGRGFGWGWGSWYSPWCYGWCLYEPVPVVEYFNPYCDCAGSVVDGIDYSVPISSLGASTVNGDNSDALAAAEAAFEQGDLDTALKATSVAAQQMPHNQDVHQFHSLVLFAARDYCKSAAVAHAVLEDGPGWTWDTLQTFYPSADIYTQQLRGLEQFVNAHTSDANARFLLAYHYMMLNHRNSAARQIAQVAELEPKDKLAANIVAGFKGPAPVLTKPVLAKRVKTETVKTDSTEPLLTAPVLATPAPIKTAAPLVADPAPVGPTPPGIVPSASESDEAPTDKPVTIKTVTPIAATSNTLPINTVPINTVPVNTVPVNAVPVNTVPTNTAPANTAAANTASANTALVSIDKAPSKPVTKPADYEEKVPVMNLPASPLASVATLTGTWKASPAKDVQIALTLREDKTFTWKFTTNGKSQDFSGKYELGDKSLALARNDGESMDGSLEREGSTGFKFRMNDADADDPGLSFSR
jgi:hypothetical protein